MILERAPKRYFKESVILSIFEQACTTVKFIHDCNVIQGYITSENMFVKRDVGEVILGN